MDERKSIMQMARGAIEERIDYEMSKVIDNILDENTKATSARTLTVTVKLTPDDKRETVAVNASAKSSLAPTNPVATALYIGKQNGEVCAVEMTPAMPGQRNFNGEEQEQPAQLKLVKLA